MMISSRRRNSLSRMLLLLLATTTWPALQMRRKRALKREPCVALLRRQCRMASRTTFPAKPKLKQWNAVRRGFANDAGEYESTKSLPVSTRWKQPLEVSRRAARPS